MNNKKAIKIETPLTEEIVRALRVGQNVLISGTIFTARDKVHAYLAGSPDPEDMPFKKLAGSILYHCGPVITEDNGRYSVIAAGPTTSQRMQMYEPFVISHYGVRGIMGKGGMSAEVAQAMKESGCVYLHAIGGAGALLAEKIKAVEGVWKLEEFGRAEAMWALRVEDFPAMVTIDSRGESIHAQVEKTSKERLLGLIQGR
ncbi:MAG: FumA C-terminus/TtdB family hydratase beta subunit [Nitrospiraceae bacterium]|nr:FumA C-terminus/TtdB family hydratase beta subunit [Nitrospiraceae bacterium]